MVRVILFLIIAALTNKRILSTETKYSRIKANVFDPVLSANSYTGHVKENERIVSIEPRLYATDADQSTTQNGKICGFELSLHKHDDVVNDITQNIPFIVEMIDNKPIVRLKMNSEALDCETKQVHRMYIRAYDCAAGDRRRYSERSPLTINVDDVNEYAPVFTHDHYLFKLHEGQTCDSSTCRVEATDDDCNNPDHRICGYEITTPQVPFSIDSTGTISITKALNNDKYEFDVIAIDCFPSNDNSRKTSQPVRVTIKILKSCQPIINDNAPAKLLIQSDHIHLFDTVKVNTCDETCYVQDIVGTVELDANGLDSGCNIEQCSTTNREYILLTKDDHSNEIPQSKITSFNGYSQALIVNQSEFSGHLSNEFTIRMWMKHTNDNKNDNNKEHIFCKSDKKLKNRHHTALFIQNDHLKLLLRKGPVSSDLNTKYTSEWMWKLSQINDNQWHSYKFVVNYPNQVDLYIDEKLVTPTKDNFRAIDDHPLSVIQGTEDTLFTLGACWHARASRMVQHFHGQLSGLSIEQTEELQRSSECIRECQQYIDIADISHKENLEFVSNSNRSMWILRTDSAESYEKLLKHLVYRNTFEPLGPSGQRKVTISTRVKCIGEPNSHELPMFTRYISIDEPKVPIRVELKADTNYQVPEDVMNRGIYLFRTLSIFTNAIKSRQADISDCTLRAIPALASSEHFIIPDVQNLEKQVTQGGVIFSGLQTIDAYQYLFRQIAYISRTPVKYADRSFTLKCAGVYDHIATNEIRVRIHIEKQMAPSAPVAAALSNKLLVNNDYMRDGLVNVDEANFRTKRDKSGWPLAVVIFVSVGLAGMLVLYLVVRVRSTNRQNNPHTNNGDDMHSQMEWEDDIGLNITVNPLDETKKAVQSTNIHNIEQTLNEYPGTSSDDEEYENNNINEYSSEDDGDYKTNSSNKKKIDHQLEWDDAAIEYGAKKV